MLRWKRLYTDMEILEQLKILAWMGQADLWSSLIMDLSIPTTNISMLFTTCMMCTQDQTTSHTQTAS